MARINIEDQFWIEVVPLVLAMSDQDKAIGHAVRFFKFAQEKHKAGKFISEEEFKRHGFLEALIPLFAERVEGGIKCVGAEKHFDWLKQKIEAGKRGGKKSAKARASKTKRNEAKASEVKQAEPSSSSSSSSSSSGSNSKIHGNLPALQPAVEENPVKVYCDEYKTRYGHNPPMGPKQAGILIRFAKNHPGRWEKIIRGYLHMPDSWSTQRSHPVEMIESKINEVVRYLETGKVVTKKVVQHAEELIDKAQGTDRKPRRSPEEVQREREEMLRAAEDPIKLASGGDA